MVLALLTKVTITAGVSVSSVAVHLARALRQLTRASSCKRRRTLS